MPLFSLHMFWVAPLQFHLVIGPLQENCCLFAFLTPVGPAQRPSFCFPVLRCIKEVSTGRHVLQDSCVCFRMFLGPGYPPSRSTHGLCRAPCLAACAKTFVEDVHLFHVRQPQPTPRSKACHQHLQFLPLLSSHILGVPHSPVLFLTFPQSPRQLTFSSGIIIRVR